jgi:DNA-binding response OmpR family regulator
MEKLATTAYDLAILDITLRTTSGLDLCRAVRRGEIEVALRPGSWRVLMLTARGLAGRPGPRARTRARTTT